MNTPTSNNPSKPPFCPFPDDFLWGAATAAYQIEGAVAEDGRTPSVWDTFSRRPGAVIHDQNGDVANDHYHRYKGDVALMKDLGLKGYRFSSSWSRVIPDADGVVNEKGLDFYERLVDELLSAGIQPWMTLFHWDLPQWAEDKFGGWESKECAEAFGDYAAVMAKRLGDRVAGIFTINEFLCFLDKAYTANPEPFAPGKVVPRKVFNQARHHAIYAHGLAVQAVRASSPRPIPVGLAENIPNVVPVLETQEHVAAAREALREMSGMYMTPIMEGQYHPGYLEDQGADAPTFTEDEMRVINTPLDLVGMNLYAPAYIRDDPSARRGWSVVHCDENYPRMDMPWLFIGPSILYWCPRLVSETWNAPPMYITENGCAAPDRPTADNQIWDIGRMMYLQQHLMNAHRAVAEGYPLKGYFLWSLMDNFEWAFGYTKRFGIHYVNYETQERIPKLSAKYYAEVIRRNALG
jgi:beta-glucosidase